MAAAILSTPLSAEEISINTSASMEVNAGHGNFAPYYIASNRHGTLTQANGVQMNLKAWKPLDMDRRFSWGVGAEGWAGMTDATDYMRYDADAGEWHVNGQRPPHVWLQQLYGEIKYLGVFLTVGLKEHESPLLNQELSSGDLVQSGNARPIPEVRVGFIDFQNIPFTNGWVQIQGEIGYGKYTDNGWQKSHYSYYNSHVNLGGWYNYKRCFFRTKPSMPFSVTVGLQAAAQFAGITYWYDNKGKLYQTDNMSFKLIDLVDMLVIRPGDMYWKGNHVGAWDFNARYLFSSGHQLKAYFQWLWEDGSGIGKLNGWDGLWGLEWNAPQPGPVSSAVVEVMTFMNQSGPLHYDPEDISGATMNNGNADGADNYYNNTWYNGYANYGMGIGSPMFPSPIYNLDGYTTAYVDNRFWGVSAGLNGLITSGLEYRVLGSYRRFFGTHFVPRSNPVHNVSAMIEADWSIRQVPGLSLKAQVAFDSGNSPYGNQTGALVGIRYSGIFNCKSRTYTPCVL